METPAASEGREHRNQVLAGRNFRPLHHRAGSRVGVSRNTIHFGTETLTLQRRQGGKIGCTQAQLCSPGATPSTPPSPETTTATSVEAKTPQPPSSDVDNAIQELYQRSSEGLDAQQSQQLRDLLQQFTDIFAARNQDCTKTTKLESVSMAARTHAAAWGSPDF